MKTTITAALALVLLAGSATAALAQDQGGNRGGRGADGGGRQGGGHNGAGQSGGGQNRGERPQFRDTERRDMMGGEDHRGQRRSQFQADQAPAAPAAPRAREAPQAPAALQAQQPRYRPQFRGDGGQGLANGQGRELTPPPAQGGNTRDRGGDRRGDGARPDWNRPDGNRPDGHRPDGNRDGSRWDGAGHRYDGRDGGDRRDWDHRNGGDRRDWDHRDDRGRPHWQQGRYPQVYRSPQRYRYGYYRPPIGFYSHNWAFGEFLPRGWYGSDYLLDSWWDYDLPYPPPGYDWVRVGSDALLIDRYSGRIVQVVRYLFW